MAIKNLFSCNFLSVPKSLFLDKHRGYSTFAVLYLHMKYNPHNFPLTIKLLILYNDLIFHNLCSPQHMAYISAL